MILVYAIIAITVLMSLSAFQSQELMDRWIMRPYAVRHGKQWYRFITSGFIHANWPHLLVNMYVLYAFGGTVYSYYEGYFPTMAVLCYSLLYVGGIIVSDIPTYLKHKDDSWYG